MKQPAAVSPPAKVIPSNRPILGAEEAAAVTKVIESGMLTHKSGAGLYAKQFEEAFAKFTGAKHAIAVNSGTSALHASLLALDIKPGDEVIVPAFTFVATTNVVLLCGAKPVFVDVTLDTYSIDPEKVDRAITARTKAILPVHLYGHPADMNPLLELARQHHLAVIEDCAQAHGAQYRGRQVGTLGDAGCFSLYPSKVITTGEGGLITTNNDQLAERLRRIRTHGETKPYEFVELGHNYRMPEIEAAIGIEQMKRLPGFLAERRKNAIYLSKELDDVRGIVLPTEAPWATHNWYLFTIRIVAPRRRDTVLKALQAANIGATVYYEVPLHLTPMYRKRYGFKEGSMPKSEQAAREVVSLPCHPALTKEELAWIVHQAHKILA
jgi:dTDP-4-amino-4,6-dideoxygalactose transaminase